MAIENQLTHLVGASGTMRPPPKKKSSAPKIPTIPGPGHMGPWFNDPQGSIKAKAAADKAAKDAADKAAGNKGGEGGGEDTGGDAIATLTMMLQQWGLESLTSTVIGMIQKGYSTNQILLELRKSDAYKQRFSGNEQRIKNGYAALDPADYLQVEDAYQRILQSAGLPKGFYDDPSDFAGWIGQNVSATEISERVGMATDAALNSDPHYLDALGQMGLNTGDLAASMLDQGRALPLLRKTVGTAKLGAASMDAGLGFNQDRASKYYSLLADANGGIDSQFATQAYSNVAAALPRANSLSSMYGENVDQGTLEDEFLGRNELASQKRRRLADLELAQYKGSGGVGDKGLGQKSRGEY
jgi:hypothetical protein